MNQSDFLDRSLTLSSRNNELAKVEFLLKNGAKVHARNGVIYEPKRFKQTLNDGI
jgi:hypothetical protein